MYSKFLILILMSSFIILTNCNRNKEKSNAEKAQPQMEQQLMQPSEQIQGPMFTGKVIETIDAGSYTYVSADSGTKKVWAAAPKFTIEKGTMVQFSTSMPMPNYQSKILNRTFELVYFTNRIMPVGNDTAPTQDQHAMAENMNNNLQPAPMNQPPQKTPLSWDFSSIKKSEKGYRIEELYAKPEQFVGKAVEVRGVVVKYNQGIMGKNWLHLQDGTGQAPNNDLTVTTDGTASVGDVVVVNATLLKDKDFGMGYKYSVILENGKVVKENTLAPANTKTAQ